MCRKPCAECPFSKATAPGMTGGSDPGVYIGQGMGPFFLPCHMDPKYYEDRNSLELTQCAGAAIYRANIGVSDIMPDTLLSLPPDKDLVFADPAELLSHHLQVNVGMASIMLLQMPPERLLQIEMDKVTKKMIHLVPKKEKACP